MEPFWFAESLLSPDQARSVGSQSTALISLVCSAHAASHVLRRSRPGPDRNIWFSQSVNGTDSYGDPTQVWSIGRITMNGAVAVYPLPVDATVVAITRGPDGNIWFTENVTDPNTDNTTGAVGRITPRWPRSLPSRYLSLTPATLVISAAITAGPDGNLRFAVVLREREGQHTARLIGQITDREARSALLAPRAEFELPGYGPPAA